MAIENLIAQLPPADELIKRCIQSLRRRKPAKVARHRAPAPLWHRVAEMTTNGSGYGMAICVKYGFNPDETWRPDEKASS